jgi:hypothetical protein
MEASPLQDRRDLLAEHAVGLACAREPGQQRDHQTSHDAR